MHLFVIPAGEAVAAEDWYSLSVAEERRLQFLELVVHYYLGRLVCPSYP